MKMLTKLIAIILLLISVIFSAYHQIAHRGVVPLESAGIVLQLIVIVLLIVDKRA